MTGSANLRIEVRSSRHPVYREATVGLTNDTLAQSSRTRVTKNQEAHEIDRSRYSSLILLVCLNVTFLVVVIRSIQLDVHRQT
jgi:hypothetical protein